MSISLSQRQKLCVHLFLCQLTAAAGIAAKYKLFGFDKLSSDTAGVLSFDFSFAENLFCFLCSFAPRLLPLLFLYLSGFTVFAKPISYIFCFVYGFSFVGFAAGSIPSFAVALVLLASVIVIAAFSSAYGFYITLRQPDFISSPDFIKYTAAFLIAVSAVLNSMLAKELIILFL